MKIITWNCNKALSRKATALFDLDPDVAIVQECEKKFVPPAGYRYLWTGLNESMGLGVFTRDAEATIEPKPDDAWTYFLPVTLPTFNIRILGTWAFHQRAEKVGAGRNGSINTVLDRVGEWLGAGRSIMAGDFNHNVRWDTPRGKNNFRPMVHRLRELGLRSAYHEAMLEGFNAETQATHLFRRNIEARYHIDYCFLHHTLPFASVEVLNSEVWRSLSDHMPLVVRLR